MSWIDEADQGAAETGVIRIDWAKRVPAQRGVEGPSSVSEGFVRRVVSAGRDRVMDEIRGALEMRTGVQWIVSPPEHSHLRDMIRVKPAASSQSRVFAEALPGATEGMTSWAIADEPEAWARAVFRAHGVALLPMVDGDYRHASPRSDGETLCQETGLTAKWVIGRPDNLILLRTRLGDDVNCPKCRQTLDAA